MIKSNKGYSLIEIGVGILILTVFLIVSIGLFNGCYSNYRRIKQRNIAIDRAVYYMENMLQTNPHVLAGFLIQDYDPYTNSYTYTPNSYFRNYIKANFDIISARYSKYLGGTTDESSVSMPSNEDLDEFIVSDIVYLSNLFIADDAYDITDYFSQHATREQLNNGTYGFFTDSGRLSSGDYIITIENEQIVNDGNSYINSNGGAFRVKKYISRIPAYLDEEGEIAEVYGDDVLNLKVEVYYTYDFSKTLTDENMQVITLNTIKTIN